MLTYKKNDTPENLLEPTEPTKGKKSKKKKKDKDSGTMSEEKSATPDLGYVKVKIKCCLVYQQYFVFRTVSRNQEVTVNLVFHVIIPKQFWEWEEKSFVSLRFGNPELGSWEKNYGSFHQL